MASGNWCINYYRKWMAYAVLESFLYKLVGKVREHTGRTKEPSAALIDTQSVKTAAGISEQTGYDGGKKVKGRRQEPLWSIND